MAKTAQRGGQMTTSKPMTKAEALRDFRQLFKTFGKRGHATAKREDWNNYTDALCKEGLITLHQYETWDQPF